MTRKRYVKLLMGQGYSRNGANLCAGDVVIQGKTYRQDYDARERSIRAAEEFQEAVEAVKRAFAETAKTFSRIAVAICEGADAFMKAYQAAMAKEKEPEA